MKVRCFSSLAQTGYLHNLQSSLLNVVEVAPFLGKKSLSEADVWLLLSDMPWLVSL